ncbi:regulatory protein RecX [Georgenia sp. Z1491]|uniref:regulatory protein RecX n=1 Tax=Georgenia sp. Z1491 TaxID=3416707 RepID=UPI003CF87E6C
MSRSRRDPAPEPHGSGAGSSAAEPVGAGASAAEPSAEDPLEAARAIALRSLAGAPRTRAQLAEKLAAKGVEVGVAETLLDRLCAVGLVDDADLADRLVRTRHSERHQGRRAIAAELRRKGIDESVAARALDQLDEEDEVAAATAVARARLRATRGLAAEVRHRRTIAALGRKGFSGDVARRAMRSALAEEDPAQDDLGEDDLGEDDLGGPDGDVEVH